jgi:hypothetical protein
MTPEIKLAIWQFVVDNLPDEFADKTYWSNERKNEPKKPFCLLMDIIPEQSDSRTSEQEIANNVQKVTMYKNTVVTIAIFNDGVENVKDLDDIKEYTKTTARNLKNNLETLDTAWTLGVDGISVNNISSLRDLTTAEAGGYNYRYEFDVTFGYNEVMTIQKKVGKDVNLQIERKLND